MLGTLISRLITLEGALAVGGWSWFADEQTEVRGWVHGQGLAELGLELRSVWGQSRGLLYPSQVSHGLQFGCVFRPNTALPGQ